MQLPKKLVCAGALSLLLVVGCAEVESPPPRTFVRVVEYQGSMTPATPLEGVEVCQSDTTNCVLSDDNGEAPLELLPEQEIFLTASKEGYLSLLEVVVPGSVYENPVFIMLSDEDAARDFQALMSPYPQMGTGSVTVILNPTPFEGATFELIGETGKAFYEEEDGTSRLDLEATPPSGKGGFVEVAPGEVQIEVGGTANGCVPARAWPGDEEDWIRVPIREGHWTTAGAVCPTP